MTDMLEAVDHLHTHGVSLPQMLDHDSQNRQREREREAGQTCIYIYIHVHR